MAMDDESYYIMSVVSKHVQKVKKEPKHTEKYKRVDKYFLDAHHPLFGNVSAVGGTQTRIVVRGCVPSVVSASHCVPSVVCVSLCPVGSLSVSLCRVGSLSVSLCRVGSLSVSLCPVGSLTVLSVVSLSCRWSQRLTVSHR